MVGVGAVGRQVAVQLAAMGAPEVELVDRDRVEDVNLGPQMYRAGDLGHYKVLATKRAMLELNPDVVVDARDVWFQKSFAKGLSGRHVFACVDNMDARRRIYEAACVGGAAWLGDARVASEAIRTIACPGPKLGDRYERSLFAQAEGFQGACTARMTVALAAVAAGLLVTKFTHHLRGIERYSDDLLSILAGEMVDQTEGYPK